eukprot:CAMPEP_0175870594 /NCGR_PEP_ID=MMETSP0107_2-20121207/36650_1 /TAXON_ID=195067 ORGANISM="Goniomonas pacifica, Strain CCMP1869" /NCGR_SAMPLE_ID=MMETSP0107_2 /ASSEMBLY_ACC=CAM_ASM_000203 /LENGTH=77 /DNA_ID=CAMNT_0017188847 /DNA_START=243 /DNA_END=476 /DNA_ORIENTATION=+
MKHFTALLSPVDAFKVADAILIASGHLPDLLRVASVRTAAVVSDPRRPTRRSRGGFECDHVEVEAVITSNVAVLLRV